MLNVSKYGYLIHAVTEGENNVSFLLPYLVSLIDGM